MPNSTHRLGLFALCIVLALASSTGVVAGEIAGAGRIDVPLLVSPADGAVDIPAFMYLDWEAISDAVSYEVDFAWPGGSEQVGTAKNWLHRRELTDGVTYTWRVRALAAGGVVGAWSETRSYTVSSSAERFGMSMQFSMVANAAGTVDPPEMAAFAFNGTGFPMTGGSDRPSLASQVSGATWGIHAATDGTRFGPPSDSTSFLATISRQGESLAEIFGIDYEIRFTAAGGVAQSDDVAALVGVPFELWSIGDNTPNATADDVRMIPAVHDHNGNQVFDVSGDHLVSGGTNDPYSDWITWHLPIDTSPGSAGYDAFASGAPNTVGKVVFHNMVLVNWNGGQQPPYDADLPESGTVIRIESGDEDIAPVNAAPPNNAVISAGPVSFYWADRIAKARQLQVATDAVFSNIVAEVDVTGRTSAVTILTDGVYYWRVNSGLDSWSEPWSLSIENGAVVGVEEEDHRRGVAVLLQNYPNPAFGSTTLAFELVEPAYVELAVFDVLGRKVRSLVASNLSSGRHEVSLETNGLNAGTYFYRMSTGGKTQTRMLSVGR